MQKSIMVYGSTWWYMEVHFKSISLYMAVHGGTLQYMEKSMIVYGSTWQFMTVQNKVYHCIWQYLTVHCSTRQSLSQFMAVHDSSLQYKSKSITVYGSTWWYIVVQGKVYHSIWQMMVCCSAVLLDLRLQFWGPKRPAESAALGDSAARYTNAYTSRFILHLAGHPCALPVWLC